jgi:hypothetical protein
MSWTLFGFALIVFGVIYLWRPTIFRRGLFMRTSIAIRTLSEQNYARYMRVLGAISIGAGVGIIALGAT